MSIISNNLPANLTSKLTGEWYSITAIGGFNVNKTLPPITLKTIDPVLKYDLTNVVQIVINKQVFNDKLGLYNDTTKVFPNDDITLNHTDFKNSINSIDDILSVGRLDTVYADFSSYVNNYFRVSGFSSILSSEIYNYNGNIFDKIELYNMIKDTVTGSITIKDINQILKYSLDNNVFGNRPKINDNTLFNNGSIIDGFRAGDLILISPPIKSNKSLIDMSNSDSTGIVVNLKLTLLPGTVSIPTTPPYPYISNTSDGYGDSNINSITTYTNNYFDAKIDEIKYSRFATLLFILK